MSRPEMSPSGRVLVLGGTAEGRQLATELVTAGIAVTSSLAGRVSSPRLPPGQVRIGGFGGVDGLAEYLSTETISAVVDATHPFAGRITGNAAAACARTGTPLLVLRRPPWTSVAGDRWITKPNLTSAATLLTTATDPATPAGSRANETSPTTAIFAKSDAAVLLTIGRQGVAAFALAPQRFWLRSVEPPEPPLPARSELILDRGPFTVDGELALMRRLSIDIVVTKNSGGPMTSAKLVAARRLGVPVVMIDRPPLPVGLQITDTVPAALEWVQHLP